MSDIPLSNFDYGFITEQSNLPFIIHIGNTQGRLFLPAQIITLDNSILAAEKRSTGFIAAYEMPGTNTEGIFRGVFLLNANLDEADKGDKHKRQKNHNTLHGRTP